MTLPNNYKKQIGIVIKNELEDQSFEDFLEEFDLTPEEVFIHLFENGLIDEQIFERYL